MANKMTGQISVVDPVQAVVLQSEVVTTLDAYDDTTDYIVDIRGMKSKRLLVHNTHAGNGLTYLLESSFDNGATWDITVQVATAVAATIKDVFDNDEYCTHWRIRMKSTSASNPATAVLKVVAIGV